jgi:hypothetical protein
LIGAAAPALGGCALLALPPQTAALAADPAPGLPARVELDAVPFFPQTPYHCGPAALATVLVQAGFDTGPEALADQVFLPTREGSLQLEMLAAARRAGALPVVLPGELRALFAELAAGTPTVLLQNLGLGFAPRWHYAVLVGFDLQAREVLLRSGTTRRQVLGFTVLERTWARSGHWAFAALPPGRLPASASETAAAEAALGFERANSAPAARAAVHDSLLARWPDNLVALIGQGNARATQGDWAGAAVSFERAAERHDSAAAWHNLGLARWQLGQREAARAAAQRALARAQAAEPQWRDAALALVERTR